MTIFFHHKTRPSARYCRQAVAFEDAMQKFDVNDILTFDAAIASQGAIPLVEDGRQAARSAVGAEPDRRIKPRAGRRWHNQIAASSHRLKPMCASFRMPITDKPEIGGGEP
jgi:hypothetical protein